MKVISLNGSWKFKMDPEGMGNLYPDLVVQTYQRDCKFFDPDYNDSDWNEIIVPSCWQAQGYNYNGAAWYRLRFDCPLFQEFNVVRLEFKGVDYFADVWLNGYYLGSHEGFFNRFSFDISSWIKEKNNVLIVKVDSPNDTNVKIISGWRTREKELIKGALQDWDVNNLEVNPGGIWNNVNLLLSRDLYIEELKVDSFINFEKKEAEVISKIKIFNTSEVIEKINIKITLSPYNFQGEEITSCSEETLTRGFSYKEVALRVSNVELWWTWDFGKPNLYRVKIEVLNKNNELLDTLEDRIGIREIKTRNGTWETYLNGKRIFFRGTNYLSDQLLSNTNRENYKKDVELIKEANMNMVRLFAIVEKEEFYELCDKNGILIYQDFPIQWRMSDFSQLVRRALPQARDMISQFYNHPSIAIWCWGSEPGPRNFEKLGMALTNESKKYDPYRLAQQGNFPFDWVNRDFPFEYFHKKYNWPIDYHCYAGWYATSKERDLQSSSVYDIEKIDKRLFEFVTEYGSQSLPELASLRKFIPLEELWPPNWKLYNYHCLQDKIMERWIGKQESLEKWIEKSQAYQAFQLKYHTEYYRLRKFRPCNGALQFCFKDCWPAITWSVVDYYRKRKLAYFALKQAFNPLHVVMDPPYDLRIGKRFSKKVYLINDYPRTFKSLRVEYVVESEKEKIITNSISCKIDENAVKEVGSMDFQFKEEYTDKEISIKLKLFQEDRLISENEYDLLLLNH